MKRILIPLAGLCLLTACNPSSHQQTEKSVTQTVNTDSIQVVHGQLIMGHEAYSFTPDADTTACKLPILGYPLLDGRQSAPV